MYTICKHGKCFLSMYSNIVQNYKFVVPYSSMTVKKVFTFTDTVNKKSSFLNVSYHGATSA